MHTSLLQQPFNPDPVFSYLTQGRLTVLTGTQTWHIHAGEYILYTRNQLAKYLPPINASDEIQAITLVLKQNILQQYARENNITVIHNEQANAIIPITPNVLLQYFIQKLSPGLPIQHPEYAHYPEATIQELLFLLLRTDAALQNILFNFSKPAKANLHLFMQRHFRFNASIQQFSYLTGRSLTAFKRDFVAAFGQPPGRWLLEKRLTEAYDLITVQHLKPTDVCWYVGFEDLSHFSFAFKKKYGISPSQAKKRSE
ncbi:AraC-type DNA-binding protein [Filimonas lacunae]|uniref:AraC-type DNA-binding protein n=1 Tax=Filimonas lacunae TaxID=477680 RepID=A0A173MCK5_9BACT|nr:AraC family transcriptional regulator [Filimonas lacunae]BAV05302.1 transcriptional regulator, AraC family [Filimonas lacunae]SIT22088.1 AraC-type DNA-binding protein [Filimonas lacunae]